MLYMCTRVAKLGVSLALKPWGNQHLHVSVLEALVAAGQRRQCLQHSHQAKPQHLFQPVDADLAPQHDVWLRVLCAVYDTHAVAFETSTSG